MRPAPLLSILLLCGCGNVTDPLAPDAAIDAPVDLAAFTLTVFTPSAAVPRDGKNRIEVGITRTGGFAGPVTISGTSLPPGLTVEGVTIAADASTAEVIVGAAAPITIGSTVTFALEATGDGVATQTAMITDAPVTGQPGALDTTFAGTGLAALSFGADDGGRFEALQVINGNIVAIGSGLGGLGAERFVGMRFTAAGAPDPTWNGGSRVLTGFTGSSNESSQAVATGTQLDGRSIAIGVTQVSNQGDIALARYALGGGAGGADFGNMTGGKGTVDLGGDEVVRGGLVLPTSKIIAVGASDGHFTVARMTAEGFLDTTFAAGAGFARTVLGTASQAVDVALDSGGRLVVAGSRTTTGEVDSVIRRYLADGAPDAALGGSGQIVVTGPDAEAAIAVVTVGEELVLLSAATSGGTERIRVRRFLASGAPDPGFGVDGLAELETDAQPRDLVVLPDGRIVVLASSAGSARLVRFTRTGALDTLFGTDTPGQVTIAIGTQGSPATVELYAEHLLLIGGGNAGGTPGPGTFGIVARMWM